MEVNDYKEEMIEGKVYFMSPSPSSTHVRVMDRLYLAIGNYLKDKKYIASTESMTIYYDRVNYVKPDLTIVRDENKFSERGYEGIPELIVEILSPLSRIYDRKIKFYLYQKIAVKEYWIIELSSKSIEQYVLKDGLYELKEVVSLLTDWEMDQLKNENKEVYTTYIKPTIFEDLKINLNDIFF